MTTSPPSPPSQTHSPPNLFRRLYQWVLHWAETRYGPAALFFLSLAEASFFPIPPDVLLMALCLGKPEKSFRFAALATSGSVLGGILGYGIGFGFWEATRDFFFAYIFNEESFLAVKDLYTKHDFWIVFVAAFTPIPYKIITITAGVCEISFAWFLFASIVGRAARFYLVSGFIYRFGQPIVRFIDRYFNLLTVVFAILLVGGFVLVKYLN